MEASDLVHEVSEPADHKSDLDKDPDAGEDEVPEPAVGSIEEVEEDDEADTIEIVGQRVDTAQADGGAVAESVESVGSEDALEEVPERVRRRRGWC